MYQLELSILLPSFGAAQPFNQTAQPSIYTQVRQEGKGYTENRNKGQNRSPTKISVGLENDIMNYSSLSKFLL